MGTEIAIALITAVIVGLVVGFILKAGSKLSKSQLKDLALNLSNEETFMVLLLSKLSDDGRFKGADGNDGQPGAPGFTAFENVGDNFCARFGKDLQICWGHAELPTGRSHVRNFKFDFLKEFSEVPTVTNGINADASGWAFSVYNHDLTTASYKGAMVEYEARHNTAPVTMNYIAIGKAK